jgi:hypothetical protein
MLSKAMRVVTLTLIVLFTGAALAIVTDQAEAAISDTLTGTVVFVDAPTGLLWFQAPDGAIVKVAAPTNLLSDLQVDQRIEMAITDASDMHTADTQMRNKVAAQVQNVDVAGDLLRLKTTDGEIIDIQASTLSLDDLQIGENVEVTLHRAGA